MCFRHATPAVMRRLLRELLTLLLNRQASKSGGDVVDGADLQMAEVEEPPWSMFTCPAVLEAREDDPQGASNRCSQDANCGDRDSEMQADRAVQFSAGRDQGGRSGAGDRDLDKEDDRRLDVDTLGPTLDRFVRLPPEAVAGIDL